MNLINDPWPWYISGPLIGLLIPLLLIVGNKSLGISSSFKHICAACLPIKNIPFFNYDWKEQSWSLFFVAGIFLGTLIMSFIITIDYPVAISSETKEALATFGITNFNGFTPRELFSWDTLSIKSFLLLTGGGFLVGFGTRYANGCTSGHAIMGLSLLSLGSLTAVIGFFIGGLIMTHFLFPFII